MISSHRQEGFTVVELLIASAVALILMTGAVSLLRQGIQVNATMGERNEMRQNARVGVNMVARDLTLAGSGLPPGGFQLPSGDGAAKARFACSAEGCYVPDNQYPDDRLYSITPAEGRGLEVAGARTDMVVIAYRDPESDLDRFPLLFIDEDGDRIHLDDALAGEASKVKTGDVLALCNVNGCAAATVTSRSGVILDLASGDPLRFNQPGAEFGNVAALADDGPEERIYPPTRAFRIEVVTYFVSADRRLMRQVGAHEAWAVAESVDDLQLDYDIVDPVSGAATASLPDAAGLPNQIRKANISIRARGGKRAFMAEDYQRLSLSTSVSARNLTFRDRYQ